MLRAAACAALLLCVAGCSDGPGCCYVAGGAALVDCSLAYCCANTTTINLDNNALTAANLGDNMFAALPALLQLSLNNNAALASLPPGLFNGISSLVGLSVQSCGLTTDGLPVGLLQNQTAGGVLQLNNNLDLAALPLGLVKNNTYLTLLGCTAAQSGCQVSRFASLFPGGTRVLCRSE